MKPLNIKRLAWTVLSVFVTLWVTDWMIHGWWLRDTYMATANMWRPEEEMHTFMGWMMTGQFLVAAFLCLIFAKGYEGKGWMEGLRFGAMIGAFAVAHILISYAVTPWPFGLFMSWVVTGWMQAVLCSVVAAWVYGWGWSPTKAKARAR